MILLCIVALIENHEIEIGDFHVTMAYNIQNNLHRCGDHLPMEICILEKNVFIDYFGEKTAVNITFYLCAFKFIRPFIAAPIVDIHVPGVDTDI